jgi:hypothetical protein
MQFQQKGVSQKHHLCPFVSLKADALGQFAIPYQ